MPTKRTPAAESSAGHPHRLTQTRILELLLARTPRDHSSVTLTRNAKGQTQIEVVVRTADDPESMTPELAAARARAIYDELRELYPLTVEQEPPAAPRARGGSS